MRKPFSTDAKRILLEAFGWSCALCGDTYGVSIHHIDNACSYSNCILNGIPLCCGKFNCHKNYHNKEIHSRLIKIVYNKLLDYGYEFNEKELTFYNGYK